MALHSGERSMTTLLEARDLTRSFEVSQGMFKARRKLHAVNGISLDIRKGEVLGIVGESGCGKSTLARMLLGLLPPTEGGITLDGTDIRTLGRKGMARRVQPVFQDPYSSLNPRRTVASIVALPLEVHGIGTMAERRKQALEILDRKSTRLNSSHANISYAVFCLKKKKKEKEII